MANAAPLPNREMAWLLVPLVLAPIAYTLESVAMLLATGGLNMVDVILPGILGEIQLSVAFAVPAYAIGLPVANWLERHGHISYGAFAGAGLLAGAITVWLIFVALAFLGGEGVRGAVHALLDGEVLAFALYGAIGGCTCALLVRWVSGWERRLKSVS